MPEHQDFNSRRLKARSHRARAGPVSLRLGLKLKLKEEEKKKKGEANAHRLPLNLEGFLINHTVPIACSAPGAGGWPPS